MIGTGAILLFALCGVVRASVSGPNVCTRSSGQLRFARIKYTARCGFFSRCTRYRASSEIRYVTEFFCCKGYKESGTQCIPICNGQEGDAGCNAPHGRCDSPDSCTCHSDYSGPSCEGLAVPGLSGGNSHTSHDAAALQTTMTLIEATSQHCTASTVMAAMALLLSSPKDECAKAPCGPLHYCENLPNGYACTCLARRFGKICGKQCPDTYSLWNSMCMKIVEEKKNWLDARKHCQKDGGDLAVLTDKRMYNFSVALMNDLDSEEVDLQVGAFKERGRWQWVDGTPFNPAMWYPGQPDNFWGPQNCAGLFMMKLKDQDKYFLLDDTHCTRPLFFVCQLA